MNSLINGEICRAVRMELVVSVCMGEASARFATPPFTPRTTLPRKNDGTANGACVIHPIHKTSFTRTPFQNISVMYKFIEKVAPKGAGSSAAMAAMF